MLFQLVLGDVEFLWRLFISILYWHQILTIFSSDCQSRQNDFFFYSLARSSLFHINLIFSIVHMAFYDIGWLHVLLCDIIIFSTYHQCKTFFHGERFNCLKERKLFCYLTWHLLTHFFKNAGGGRDRNILFFWK